MWCNAFIKFYWLGPFKVNGVPLRRVNQAYVIATSTTVDVSKVDVSKLTDKDFAQTRKQASAAKDFLAKNPNQVCSFASSTNKP